MRVQTHKKVSSYAVRGYNLLATLRLGLATLRLGLASLRLGLDCIVFMHESLILIKLVWEYRHTKK